MFSLLIKIIIVIVIIAIIGFIAENLGVIGIIAGIAIALFAVYKAFGLQGLLYFLGAVGIIFVIVRIVSMITRQVQEHDKAKIEAENIKMKTQDEQQMHENEMELRSVLDENCRELGFMDKQKWHEKLANYANKKYKKSFDTITENFAKQIEYECIVSNNDWFEPYKLYVVRNSGGVTVEKMLREVDCSALKMTHHTPDRRLVEEQMEKGLIRVSADVPPLFDKVDISSTGADSVLYAPTPYLMSLYSTENSTQTEDESSDSVEEFDFDDL